MRLRLLADDLTGALDSAAAFDGGMPVVLDAPPPGDDAEASAVATATRDVAPAELPALLAPSLPWLDSADIAFKKIDSLLRGNTFAEIAWLAAQGGFARVVVAPAFPRQRRLVVDGRLQVDGQAAGEPIAARLAAAGLAGAEVPDVADDAGLARVVASVGRPEGRGTLWCGSAGLAQALAAATGRAAGAPPPLVRCAPLLMVSASHHDVSRRQWDRLAQQRPAAMLARHGQGLAAALGALAQGRAEVLVDLAPSQVLDAAAAAALLRAQAAEIVAAATVPGVLVVVGGDTLRALCAATGAQALRARPAARPGWGCAVLQGGAWDGVTVHARSGAFGDLDDLADAVAALAPAA